MSISSITVPAHKSPLHSLPFALDLGLLHVQRKQKQPGLHKKGNLELLEL